MSYFIFIKSDDDIDKHNKVWNGALVSGKSAQAFALQKGWFFIGDGHSSHHLISEVDRKNSKVRIFPEVADRFIAYGRFGLRVSFVVIYETSSPDLGGIHFERKHIKIRDLIDGVWLDENVRYYFE